MAGAATGAGGGGEEQEEPGGLVVGAWLPSTRPMRAAALTSDHLKSRLIRKITATASLQPMRTIQKQRMRMVLKLDLALRRRLVKKSF